MKKIELLLHVWLAEGRNKQIEGICDHVCAAYGYSKREAGILPNGKPVGYIYSKGTDLMRLSIFDMGKPPYAAVHVHRGEEGFCTKLKEKLSEQFSDAVSIVGQSNKRPN